MDCGIIAMDLEDSHFSDCGFVAMDLEKFGDYNKSENNFTFQNVETESLPVKAKFCRCTLELDKLPQFVNEHFKDLYQKETLCDMLTFVHRCLEVSINQRDYSGDIGIPLANLIADHSGDESALNIVLQIIFQILNSIKHFGTRDVPISEKVLLELFAIMPLIKTRTSASNCIACIQKYLEILPEKRKNLEPLWSYLKQQLEVNLKNGITSNIDIDILIQLIDDFKLILANFHDEPILVSVIQHLLKSDEKKNRKYGYYLLKKCFHCVIENINSVTRVWMNTHHIQQIERSWIMYNTILENLEEEQSHLILPSLENLEEIIKYLSSSWLNILYVRILTHNNHLVTRWSIVFLLNTYTCSDLCGETLKYLLQATNSNSLFNYEEYFLKEDYFASFLKGDVMNVLTQLSEIENWKSIPLYIWLLSLDEKRLSKSLTFKQILKISSCVRKLQNRHIRKLALCTFQRLFKHFIQKMSMQEYVTYIETIYNTGDKYLEHEMFFSKKLPLVESKTVEGSIFTQRFYEIFTNTTCDNSKLLLLLNDAPVAHHGWLKFAPFQLKLEECERDCIMNLYKLDLNLIKNCDIHKIINIFKSSLIDLVSYDKHELSECTQAAISFYIWERSNFNMNDDEETLRFILNTGIKNSRILDIFAAKLLNNTKEQIDLWFIDELLKSDSREMLKCVIKYLRTAYDEKVVEKYAINILNKGNYKLIQDINLLKVANREWLKKLPAQGDRRIEEAFLFHHSDFNFKREQLYSFNQIQKYCDDQYILDLLKYHKDITKKKPRYFENSNEHYVKLKIAMCIGYYYCALLKPLKTQQVLDQIWDIVLNENNQLNIKYIYEFILGCKEKSVRKLLNQLKSAQNLTPSQQLSVISVANTQFKYFHSSQEDEDAIVYSLLTLTMGANFQIRLLAQMSLYEHLDDLENCSIEAKVKQQIIQSIENAAGAKLPEYRNDIRLNMHKIAPSDIECLDLLEFLLYMTNAPFDLIGIKLHPNKYPKIAQKLRDCRKWYMDKFNVVKNKETAPKNLINDQIQRKMNPVDDLTESPSLMLVPDENSAEMFVVASLIDKLPNLGGIARSCEVLGIKNLVVDSILHTEKDDFKSLSMTAEKNLNILEVKPKDVKQFLFQKKLEGFNIVGAEQTCNSENFSSFQFPEKCVLLLGHEKDGIPAPLLSLIDNAVEIPQFGKVRSLNVHVTGALFMWEYCKQHLIKK